MDTTAHRTVIFNADRPDTNDEPRVARAAARASVSVLAAICNDLVGRAPAPLAGSAA